MLDLNNLRDEFSRYLHDNTGQRHSMDGALMHVCRVAYEQGLLDGQLLAEVAKPALPLLDSASDAPAP